jgi:hypothetical protein
MSEVVESLPVDVDDVQQDESTGPELPIVVAVRHDGPIRAVELPARNCAPSKLILTTDFQHVLGPDLKRKRVILLADAAWEYSRTGAQGSGVPWPTSVALVLQHADAIYARVPTSTGNLSVFPEVWAD